ARCHEQDCGLNMGQLRMQISGESGSVFSAIQHIGLFVSPVPNQLVLMLGLLCQNIPKIMAA
ncbi:hypothetical protein, partial [Herbaspirillum aquaticum]|uniref:hypothetical protein n=1 Tax=Herbaspirillum aquaticum TaxID=568783 RepID=UPI0019D4506E